MDDYNISESSLSNSSSYFAISVLTLCDLRLSDSDTYSCTGSNNVSVEGVVSSFTMSVEGNSDKLTQYIDLFHEGLPAAITKQIQLLN